MYECKKGHGKELLDCWGDKVFTYAGAFPIYSETEDYIFKNPLYIDRVTYSNPATIVFWSDGTKTVSKCHPQDKYCPEVGLIIAVNKKLFGTSKVHDIIDTWVPKNIEEFKKGTQYSKNLKDVRNEKN